MVRSGWPPSDPEAGALLTAEFPGESQAAVHGR